MQMNHLHLHVFANVSLEKGIEFHYNFILNNNDNKIWHNHKHNTTRF